MVIKADFYFQTVSIDQNHLASIFVMKEANHKKFPLTLHGCKNVQYSMPKPLKIWKNKQYNT